MQNDIVLNGLDLTSGPYRILETNLDEPPKRKPNALKLALQDGEKLISSTFASKDIIIRGIILGTSQSDVDSSIDNLKENILPNNEYTLSFTYAGATRNIVVTILDINIPRKSVNSMYTGYMITCVAFDPMAVADDQEVIIDGDTLTAIDSTKTNTYLGTAPPKPRMQFTIETLGNLASIGIKNKETNSEIIIERSFIESEIIIIDNLLKSVSSVGDNIAFDGVFPNFIPGSNELLMSLLPSGQIAKSFLDILTYAYSIGEPAEYWTAQSVVVDVTGDFTKVDINLYPDWVRDDGLQSGANVTVRIETDNAGEPSGTLADVDAEITVDNVFPTPGGEWVSFEFPGNVTLTDGVVYWIVISGTMAGANGTLVLAKGNNSSGNDMARSLDSGSNWTTNTTDEIAFKLYGDVAPTFSVDVNIVHHPRYL